MATRSGGGDRVSTKSKLARELTLLGEVLASIRESKKLKQGEVASRLGLPPSYLSKIENGTRRLDVIELVRICEAMEVDPADVMRELQEKMRG